MRRYLLLFVMSLACIIGMQAKITVVPPTESTSGAYELTFSNGDATATGEYANMADLPVYVKNATSLVFKTAEGYSLGDDETTQIMGSQGDYEFTATLFPNLEKLDMGEAVLGNNAYLVKMKYAKPTNDPKIKGLQKLKSFVFPKSTTAIPTGVFNENTTLEEIILLENAGLTVIPENAFQGCRNLSIVRIPDGITLIGENAFEHCAFEAIFLPNSLTEIGKNAFGDCGNLKSVTIPASVTKIGTSAFQLNYSMTDVYVLGNNVKIGDGAFNQNETYNFKNEKNKTSYDFSDWEPATTEGSTDHPLLLHIPNNTTATQNYVNPYLRALNDPEMEDLFDQMDNVFSPGPTQNKVNEILQRYGIQPDPDSHQYQYEPFKKGKWVEVESVDGSIKKFFREAGSFFNGNGDLIQGNDYGGWRNFMLVAGDIDKKTWPDTRLVESRWYSAVFPFDMSYNQVESVYGTNTDVREFTNVCEHTVNGKLTRTVRFNTKPSIPSATSWGGTTGDKNMAGYIKAGRPYMIHPGTRVEIIEVDGKEYGRTIAGVNVKEAQAIVDANSDEVLETVKRPLVRDVTNTSTDGNDYFFRGTFKPQTLPANSFYLGYDPKNPTRWPLAFYVTTTDLAEKWSEFTSIVRKTDNFATDNSNAKSMGIDFTLIIPEEEIFGITTGIESVSDQKSVNNGIVYNLNGQIIGNQSTSNLSKGIYIVNGKKIVVR